MYLGGAQVRDGKSIAIDQATAGLRSNGVKIYVLGLAPNYDPQIARQVASNKRNVYPENQNDQMKAAIVKGTQAPLVPITPLPGFPGKSRETRLLKCCP